MCAILGWNGKMPKGLISNLLRGMESRGRDSTGIAFRVKTSSGQMQNKCYRLADTAHRFVTENESILSDARRSVIGIAHTRRASPNMPINDRNAHPFPYWRFFFAHNGKIQNWRTIKSLLQNHFASEAKRLAAENNPMAKTAEYCTDYANSITTDSMVLGPYIESRDFRSIQGCMGLVWMMGPNVYTLRFEKEAVACTVVWRYTSIELAEKETSEDEIITVVASTPEIIKNAFEKCSGIEFELGSVVEFTEGHIYRIEPDGLLDEGAVPMGIGQQDKFSSDAVASETGTPVEDTTVDPAPLEEQPILKNNSPEPTPESNLSEPVDPEFRAQ